MNYTTLILDNKDEFINKIRENALNPKKISEFTPFISQIDNILTSHISYFLNTPDLFI